jgi:hypothetical protein
VTVVSRQSPHKQTTKTINEGISNILNSLRFGSR